MLNRIVSNWFKVDQYNHKDGDIVSASCVIFDHKKVVCCDSMCGHVLEIRVVDDEVCAMIQVKVPLSSVNADDARELKNVNGDWVIPRLDDCPVLTNDEIVSLA